MKTKTTTIRKVECRRCDGSGILRKGYSKYSLAYACDMCIGSGFVNVEDVVIVSEADGVLQQAVTDIETLIAEKVEDAIWNEKHQN